MQLVHTTETIEQALQIIENLAIPMDFMMSEYFIKAVDPSGLASTSSKNFEIYTDCEDEKTVFGMECFAKGFRWGKGHHTEIIKDNC